MTKDHVTFFRPATTVASFLRVNLQNVHKPFTINQKIARFDLRAALDTDRILLNAYQVAWVVAYSQVLQNVLKSL